MVLLIVMVDIGIVVLVILVITSPDHLENGVIEIKALVKEVETILLEEKEETILEVKEGNRIPDREVDKVLQAQEKVNKFVERKIEVKILLKKMMKKSCLTKKF